MTKCLIITNEGAEEVSEREFYRRRFGHYPRVVTAEEQARRAKSRLAGLIHDTEYAVARREREALIRKRCVEGGDIDINEPFERAAERVRVQMAEIERKLAA